MPAPRAFVVSLQGRTGLGSRYRIFSPTGPTPARRVPGRHLYRPRRSSPKALGPPGRHPSRLPVPLVSVPLPLRASCASIPHPLNPGGCTSLCPRFFLSLFLCLPLDLLPPPFLSLSPTLLGFVLGLGLFTPGDLHRPDQAPRAAASEAASARVPAETNPAQEPRVARRPPPGPGPRA